jgi:hypothetical protein
MKTPEKLGRRIFRKLVQPAGGDSDIANFTASYGGASYGQHDEVDWPPTRQEHKSKWVSQAEFSAKWTEFSTDYFK